MKAVYLLYCASGFVSLGYQIVWFRVFFDRFGSSNLTFGFVLCNFIGGLGVGSLAGRPLTEWISRRARLTHGLRVYGVLEMMVAAAAMLTLLVPLIPADAWGSFPYTLSGDIYEPTTAYRLSQVAVSTVCVFIPCFLMGATFPLLCNVFRADSRFPSALYGWNTLGACSGVLACEFFFLPLVGHNHTFLLMIALNFGLGLYFLLARKEPRGQSAIMPMPAAVGRSRSRRYRSVEPMRAPGVRTYPVSVALGCAVISGLLAGALEADVLRRLQFLDCRSDAAMSFISFWAILAIFLASWTVRATSRLHLGPIKIAFLAALTAYLSAWYFAFPLRDWANALDHYDVIAALPKTPGVDVPFQFFYFGYGARSVLLFTGVFVFPPFYLISLLLPHICNVLQSEKRHLGALYGANTIVFCVGMAGFTLLAPRVNVFYSFRLFMLLFALLTVLLLTIAPGRPLGAWRPGAAVLIFAAACAATPSSFDTGYFAAESVAAKYPVRAMKSNGAHTTFVVEDPAGDVLFFDSHSMSGTNAVAQQYMRLMAHYPLLAHRDPKEALLICFGVGCTASAIAWHDTIERIDVIELNDKVLETAPEFAVANGNVAQDPRVRLIHDDGRRFLNLIDRKYDLITSEPPPPMLPGVYRLYSEEYYASALAHLAPRGMMTQWLPIGQMPRQAVGRAISAFVSVFPHTMVFVGHGSNYILLGSNRPIDLTTIEERFGDSEGVVQDLRSFGIVGPVDLLARIVMYGGMLRREFGGYAPVSDQRNDFSQVFHDPYDPAVITYDPVELLSEMQAKGLDASDQLRRTILHLGRLKTAVPDFPESALMSVRATEAGEVALTGVDWNRINLLFRSGMQAAQDQQLDDSIEFLQRALRVTDQLPYVLKHLGSLQSNAQRYAAALRTWKNLQVLEPADAAGYYGAGWVLIRLQRFDEAVAELNSAVQLNPNDAETLRALGDALASGGRWSDALIAYDRALSLNPDDESLRKNRNLAMDRVISGSP